MNRIIIRDAAAQDLREIADYFAAKDLALALRFAQAVDETLNRLVEMPGMGSPKVFKNPRLAGLRNWRVRGFDRHLIYYLATEGGIDVLHIVHAARDLTAVFGE